MGEFLEIIKWHEIIRDGLNYFEDNLDNFPKTDVDVLVLDTDGYHRVAQYYYVYFSDNDGINGINHCFIDSGTNKILDVVGWAYVLGPMF